MKKKVNIILNCFNGSEFLEDCLKNIQSQSFNDWSLIFWDNCSTDNSAEIFKSFIDNRFHYFLAESHTNLGIARNLALNKVNCDFVSFIDVDDGWTSDKLEKQIKVFDDRKVALSYTNYHLLINNKQTNFQQHKLPSRNITNNLLKDYNISWHTVMIRMEVLRQLSYVFNENYHVINDFDLVLRISLNWKISSVDEFLGFMRVHDNQEMKKKKKLIIKENLRFILTKENIKLYGNLSGFNFLKDKIMYEKISYQIKKFSLLRLIKYTLLLNNIVLRLKILIKFFLINLKK